MQKLDEFFEQNKQIKIGKIKKGNLRNILFLLAVYAKLNGIFSREGVVLERFIVLVGDAKVTDEIVSLLTSEEKQERISVGCGVYSFRRLIAGQNDRMLFFDVEVTPQTERRAKDNVRYVKKLFCEKTVNINERQRIVPVIPVTVMIPQIGIAEEDYLLIPVEEGDVQQQKYAIATEQKDFFSVSIIPIVEERYQEIRRKIKNEKEEFFSEDSETLRTLKIVAGVVAEILGALVGEDSVSDFRREFLYSIDFYQKRWESELDLADLAEIMRVRLGHCIKDENVSILNRFHIVSKSTMAEKTIIFQDEDYYYFSKDFLREICNGELSVIPLTRILNTLKNEGVLKRTKSVDSKDLTIVTTLFYEDGTEQRKRFVAVTRAFVDGD